MLHVTARIKLLKTEAGGRTSWVRSGYRPNIRFGDLYTDGVLTFLDHEQVYPGDKCEVRVTFAIQTMSEHTSGSVHALTSRRDHGRLEKG